MIEQSAVDEAFHVLDGFGRQFFSITRKGNHRYFGPDSQTKVKFRHGLLQRGGILKRTLELVAQGKSDYAISRIIPSEFPGKSAEYPFIRQVRRVLEGEAGVVINCPCGLPANHKTDCRFKMKPLMRNRALDAEAARSIRAEHAVGNCTYTSLARKWEVRIGTIIDIVKGDTHRPFPLRLGKYKASRIETDIRKVLGCVQRLEDGRSFHVHDANAADQEARFDGHLAAARQSIEAALESLSNAARV